MLQAVINGQLVLDGQLLRGQALLFDDRILEILPLEQLPQSVPLSLIDAAGGLVSPGLIDTHLHGLLGADVMDGQPEALQQMSQALTHYGVTAWLPTTMSMGRKLIVQALQTIGQAATQPPSTGARVLGAHLEGPFLNREYAGAQAVDSLVAPDLGLIADFAQVIKLVTYAPELDHQQQLLAGLLSRGIIPSIGHSGASYELARQAIALGVRHATHLWNGMAPLHHRQPGVIGAALECAISAELIADDLHLHPAIYRLLLRCIGPQQIILVSDGMRATGLPPGDYDLGGQLVTVQGGAARLPGGRLAGSVLTLNQAVANWQAATGVSWPAAIGLASAVPARLLGLADQLGSLAPGHWADIVIFDHQMQVQRTILQGRTVYTRDGGATTCALQS